MSVASIVPGGGCTPYGSTRTSSATSSAEVESVTFEPPVAACSDARRTALALFACAVRKSATRRVVTSIGAVTAIATAVIASTITISVIVKPAAHAMRFRLRIDLFPSAHPLTQRDLRGERPSPRTATYVDRDGGHFKYRASAAIDVDTPLSSDECRSARRGSGLVRDEHS